MSDDLMVIRTFISQVEADVALAQLQAAGIQALLLSDGPSGNFVAAPQGLGLAVHQRDADRATTVLEPSPRPS